MLKMFLVTVLLIAASFILVSCGEQAGNGVGANKPANAANNAAAAPAANAAIETEIKKLANDGVAAITKGDTATIDKLWADNYMFISQDGAVSTKAQRLDAMKSGETKIESLSYDELSVRSNPEGTGAILIGRATVKGKNMGKPVDGQVRFTQVWSKTKDGWRQVSGQVTPITAAAPAAGLPTPAKPGDTAPANANTKANAGK